jgi:ribonuclease-3
MRTSLSKPTKKLNSGDSDSTRRRALLAFQKKCGVSGVDLALLGQAFVHRSVSNEEPGSVNNERLEFLGDAVLGCVAASMLYLAYPEKSEGMLAKVRAVVVSEDVLSGVALELELDRLLVLGAGEENTGGRSKRALLADCLEAVIGAFYLSAGYKKTALFINRLLKNEIEQVVSGANIRDYKSLLQERCQKLFRVYPSYKLVKQSGAAHNKYFWIELRIKGQVYGEGMDRSKKAAEQIAAKMALEKLDAADSTG